MENARGWLLYNTRSSNDLYLSHMAYSKSKIYVAFGPGNIKLVLFWLAIFFVYSLVSDVYFCVQFWRKQFWYLQKYLFLTAWPKWPCYKSSS